MTREIVFEHIARVTVPGSAFSGPVSLLPAPYSHLFPVPCSLFPRKRRSGQAGVTLLELLVSITIVALLAATALFAWRVGVSAWEKADAQLERDRRILAAHRLLQEQMASMVPYEAWTARGGRAVFFQGEAETARFVSRTSLAHRAASGLFLIEYHVTEADGGTKQLLVRETPVRGNTELGAMVAAIEPDPQGFRLRLPEFERDAETMVLLEGLRECRFGYYRRAATGEEGSWTDQWIGRADEVPPAMRIEVAAQENAGALAPVTIVGAVRNFARWKPPGPLGF